MKIYLTNVKMMDVINALPMLPMGNGLVKSIQTVCIIGTGFICKARVKWVLSTVRHWEVKCMCCPL